jgi:membrane associated rhomboid family serine protease
LFFALVTLISGLVFTGVDNAAHVGGFVAGTCVGLAFHSPRRMVRIVAPAMLATLVIFTGFTLGTRAGSHIDRRDIVLGGVSLVFEP